MLTESSRLAAAEFPDTAAFIDAAGWAVTYSELDRAADEAAIGLTERGLGDNSVLGLVLPSAIDYLVLYLAAARIGTVTAGINPKLTEREIAGCLSVLQADLVVTTSDLAGDWGDTAAEVLSPGDSADSVALQFRSAGANPAELASDDDRPVCICFTSGSTGQPKGAWYTNRQLRRIAELDTGGAWGGGGHGLASTQFAHVGFMTKLPWMLQSGRTTHLLSRWSAGPVLELISKHQMPAVAGVAPQIALMLRHESFDSLNFGSVKAIVAGGAASPPALVKEARERFGAGYSIRYSSTESGGIGLGTALDADDEEAFFTIGRPRPGVAAKVAETDGTECASGTIGELWLRSDCVMSGYWNDEANTAETLVDGWLRTGDLAYVDDAGCFRLAGRAKEMFVRGGYNVYPMEVEAILGQHPDVAEIAVVPRPDDVMGEIGVAVVVASGAAPSLDELRAFGADDLAAYKLPEAIEYRTELPRNASDKVDRRQLSAEVTS